MLRASKLFASLVLGLAACAPAAASTDPAATGSLIGPRLVGVGDRATAAFEPAFGETTVIGHLPENRCFVMRLPDRWQLTDHGLGPAEASGGEGFSLRGSRPGTELDIAVHDAETFGGAPGSNLAAGYAEHLRLDYEELMGRPALGSALENAGASGAYRWRATWSDNNFNNAARALSFERFIAQLSPTAVIELSAGSVMADGALDEVVSRALSTLELRQGAGCRF